jgi:hypothetical protein
MRKIVAENALTLLRKTDQVFFPLNPPEADLKSDIAYVSVGTNKENAFAKRMKAEYNATVFYFDYKQDSSKIRPAVELIKKGNQYCLKSFACESFDKKYFENGEIIDNQGLFIFVGKFVKKHKIYRAKVSVPEEKVYLFTTTVPSVHEKTVYQNIESKLEENIPLKASDCIFSFDFVGHLVEQGEDLVSVTVTQESYIEKLYECIKICRFRDNVF